MNILVTGGAGYLGSVLSQLLLAQGHQVRVVDSLLNGGASVLGLYAHDNFEFVQMDIRDLEQADDLFGQADTVVHLAAIVGDPACARQPELTRDVNLRSAIKIFDLSRGQGIKQFVFASTCSNYGKMPDSSRLATEESELKPISLYAETKVAVERALLDSGDGIGPEVTVLRLATLFGLSPRMRFDLTVNQFAAEMLTKRYLQVYGEQFWRPYVHVRDAARAIAIVLGASPEQVSGQVFNVGDTSQNFQKQQLVQLINQRIGNSAEVEFIHKDEDPRDYRVSFEKIKSALDFHITRTVQDGINEVIDAINQGIITDWEDSRYSN